MENTRIKKTWKTPEICLLDAGNDVNVKHIGSNEHFYTKTVPIGGGHYRFYHSNISEGVGTVKLASVLS